MKFEQSTKPQLEDVASLAPAENLGYALSEVGLENVQNQVQVQGLLLPARTEAAVSLADVNARGIHMSRLFKIISRLHEHELSWPSLTDALEQMLVSHAKLSDAGRLEVRFELPVLRQALLSGETGWRNYPVTYKVSMRQGRRDWELTTRVLYSSTCPCSESLSRQALAEKFLADFSEPELKTEQVAAWLASGRAIVAAPHAQRSEALCRFRFDGSAAIPSALSLIDEVENALGTPVQSAVKREDEQEFARRNAQNLMFCEDAARKVKAALMKRTDVADFQIEVRHFESLHPHDVVAKVGKFD